MGPTFDGHCSGAIIKDLIPACEMIGINYGDKFPWDSIAALETVYMVDFCLQPFSEMERLAEISRLVWIDHHKTAIDQAQERGFDVPGIQRVGIGACELVWQYIYPDKPVPVAVKLLAEYDVWDHENPDTLPFQYGFRFFEDTRPDNTDLWHPFLDAAPTDPAINDVMRTGRTIMKYEERQNEKFCRSYAFETKLEFIPDDEGYCSQLYRCICVNRGCTNSKVLDGVYDPEKYDLMVTFCRLPSRQWTVSLYSTKDGIDCGRIARGFGGGGHKGAAGFQRDRLPFEH